MFLDNLKPGLYAFVKKNQWLRNMVMPAWNFAFKMKAYITALLSGEENFGPPAGLIVHDSNFQNRIGKNELRSVLSFKEISGPREINRALPFTIDTKVYWKYVQKQKVTQPTTYVMEIEDGRAYDDGIVITEDNLMLADVSKFIISGEYLKDASQHPIFSKNKLPVKKRIKGSVAVLSAPSGRGYYHWMFDVLPRIQLLREGGYDLETIDKFFINICVSKFHIETLKMIGIPRDRIIESQFTPHIQADKLIVPSLVGDTGSVPGYACDFLRSEFLGKSLSRSRHSKRIYVNRGNVAHRRVTNEKQIIDLLKPYGFESIALETLSLTEQISLMVSAEVVIAPHGAGLTNIVFCNPGTQIIELLHPAAVNVMYWTICNEVGLRYYYLLANGEIPPDFIDPYLNSEDLEINIENLTELLKMANIELPS